MASPKKLEIMKKRTNIDLSKHVIEVTKTENVLIHRFAIPNTYTNSVKFINTNGIMAVTGDFGNWIFCREFHPSADGMVSDHYWIEKLHIASSQVGEEFDSRLTRKEIELGLESQLEEYGYDGEELEEMKEYYNDLLDNVDYSEWEYTSYAYSNKPNFLDAESVPFLKDTKSWLKVIFDCFDEICDRIKKESLVEQE